LRRLRIGRRLQLVFACVLLLMFIGFFASLWHIRELRAHVESVSRFEQRMTAVLQLENRMLTLVNRLHYAAETRQFAPFEAEAQRFLGSLTPDSAWRQTLRGISPATGRQRVILESLNAMLYALPGRVRSLVELARSGDWAALHARLLNQVDHTDDVIAALVREIDADLTDARTRLLDSLRQTQRRAAQTLAAAGVMSLALAGLLGIAVTRSITRPLASLGAGTEALAQGDLGYQVAIDGSDELAQLAGVFNQTSRELNRLYARIRLSEAHFRGLIENAADLIIVLNRTGEIVYASPSSSRVLGLAPNQLMGRPIQDFVGAEQSELAGQLFAEEELPFRGARAFDLTFRRADGWERTMEGVATNLLDEPAVAGFVVNARDISERRQAEQALREREEQLRQAQKMEAVGRLAAGIAHDFNNLLTAIMGNASLAVDLLTPEHAASQHMRGVVKASEHAAHLTRQLLAYAGKGQFVLEPVDLSTVVREIGELLRASIPKSVALRFELGEPLPSVSGDRGQLQQVVMNLLINAGEAIAPGKSGTVVLRTGVHSVEAHSAQSASAQGNLPPGAYVVLEVEDTGAGMDPATLARIFDPFFTTKFTGRGLGLAAVLGIVRSHNGLLQVDSEPNKGSTFRILIPVTSDRAPEAAAAPASRSRKSRAAELILFVDDEEIVRDVGKAALERDGFSVLLAGNGSEALDVYQRLGHEIVAVVLDLTMPVMGGEETLRRLKALRPNARVVLTSGYNDVEVAHQFAGKRLAGFLQKPYTAEALVDTVNTVLASVEESR
jgi:PAS domain S-box-containing protein